jgi:hypothetical protein
MKIFRLITAAFVLIAGTSCEDVMEQKVGFEVEVAAASGLQFTDSSVIAPKGSTIRFNFDGEPDFISFSYVRFLPTNATLKFATQAAWGASIPNTLQVYLSESFEGLTTTDFGKDSIAVKTHAWQDVSTLSNLPVAANVKQNASLPINDFRKKKLVIAFRYKPTVADDWQPSWNITDLRIENTRITDNSLVTTFLAATMGFTPFDVLNRANAYRNEYVSGVWSTTIPAQIQMRQTARNNPLNEDWLISRPIEVPAGLTENSVAKGVKNTTLAVESYSHTFDQVGEYDITFKAANHNYMFSDSVSRTLKVVITD